MTVLITKNKFSHFCIFLWIIFPGFASAQSIFEQIGRLPVTVYTSEEYGGSPFVYSAVQSDAGLMYFGTRYGINEYDGVSWRSLFDRNTTLEILNFTKDAKGRIFYVGQDFGYLDVGAKGETKAVSLLPLIPEELRDNFFAIKIHYLNGYILLQTRNHHLIRLELAEDFTVNSLKTWQAETRFGGSFVVGEDFYITEAERGLSRLIGDEIKLIPNTESLGIERINVMLPYSGINEKNILIGRPVTGFYLFDGTSLSKFPTQVDQLIKEGAGWLVYAISYQGNYILSFAGSGIVIMNPEGEILNRLGTEQGLPSDVVSSIYLDHAQGLWAMTEDGMARIAIDSPIQTFGKEFGITSGVFSIQKQGDDFYLGTTNGLVKFDKKSNTFQSVPGIGSSSISVLTIDGEDLIVTGGYLNVYRDGKAFRLEFPKDGSLAWSSYIPKNNPNLMLIGTNSGLLLYERGLSKEFPWELKGKVPGIDAVYTFSEGKDGTVFTAGRGKTYVLNLDGISLESEELSRIKSSVFEFDASTNFPMIVEGEYYIFSLEKIQKYSSKEGKFEITEEFRDVEKDIFDLNQGKAGIIWYESKAGKKFILKKDEEGKFVKDETPNSVSPYLSGLDFLDEDSIMWFGSPKGLLRYDPKKDNHTDKQFFTLIRMIETKTDTLPLIAYGRDKNLSALALKENSLRFEFAAPYFEEEKKTKYQTYLEGFDADWVDWNDNKFKEYTNLPAGKYTFHIRAQAFTGRVSEEAVFSFVVLPPWYATWWAYLLYVLLLGGLITGIVKWRSQKLKAENRILEERVNERTAALEKSLNDLKSTQAQLIQSEKMASLGELTAGIAHEIQNPLNFVNNFSEVSEELIEEIKESRAKNQESRQWTEADKMEEEILDDIKQNLEKIHHHGKRADAIVKGMLEHSRSVSGEKELTNLNTLTNEYLNLAYQSFKNKNKDFKGTIQTDFDSALPKIKIARQDIGRVLLNLINNAFYATHQPSKGLEPLEGYIPIVKVSTKNLSHKIEISISDNGPGIPDSIKDKIFQPFFTTKPTGQGTGLGLSLSYDIVKAHGGEIRVDSLPRKESGQTFSDTGTEFIITLPIQ